MDEFLEFLSRGPTRKLIDDGVSETEANQKILDELAKRSLDSMIQNQGRMPP